MSRTLGPNGVEIRNYVHGADVSSCFSNAGAIRSGNFVNSSAFTSCSSGQVVCNNVFYIKDGKVLEYAPAGRCYTTSSLQPEAQYMRLRTQYVQFRADAPPGFVLLSSHAAFDTAAVDSSKWFALSASLGNRCTFSIREDVLTSFSLRYHF